jgi:hypothetical protein
LEFWRNWPLEASDNLGAALPSEREQAVVSGIVAAESEGDLLLSFWSERQTAIWFGDVIALSQLKAVHATRSR